MADGILKNIQVVIEQVRDSLSVWWADIGDTWERIGEAVDDGNYVRLPHLLLAGVGDTMRLLFRMDRLWLYVFVAWLVSLTGLYQFPVSVQWLGF